MCKTCSVPQPKHTQTTRDYALPSRGLSIAVLRQQTVQCALYIQHFKPPTIFFLKKKQYYLQYTIFIVIQFYIIF
jgi:hypothetical protein